MLGYCCNVHPGRSLAEVRQSLTNYSLPVKQAVSPDAPLGIGLWFSATTAQELRDESTRLEFRDWLERLGLVPYTLNGFPYGNFHEDVVKHQVYLPTWADESRLQYTLDLARILDVLLPAGAAGTISTLPLGWPTPRLPADRSFLRACAANLQCLAESLADLQTRTGRQVTVCLEPEPGCVLDSADDLIRFFEDELKSSAAVRTHLGICHDICHSAVMFEEQDRAIEMYRDAGIRLGKVQVSSAVNLDFENLTEITAADALTQLEAFAEPRYLHQTCWRVGASVRFFEDLPQAIAAVRASGKSEPDGVLRVHFHVPIFAEQLGLLSTTQADIEQCLSAIFKDSAGDDRPSGRDVALADTHFEVETYAWNVIPDPWRPESLPTGIARELTWLRGQLDRI